jgi:hypothetical protein
MVQPNDSLEITPITDPGHLAVLREQAVRFERNWDWIEAHAGEVYSHRGKFICVAGEELFVGETQADVVTRAKAAHPEDTGRVTRYIPVEKGPRVYANGRLVALV